MYNSDNIYIYFFFEHTTLVG